MLRSILVPLDGSPFGEQALPLALSIARRAGAVLQLVHVHRPVVEAYTEDLSLKHSLDLSIKKNESAYLDLLADRLEAVDAVPVTQVLLQGDVAASLRTMANGTGVDLIVMTTHGRGGLDRLWLGSVADELVREVPAPLLLVRPKKGEADFEADPVLKHILLPLDGSALAEQMLKPAVALGSVMDADYTLLRAIQLPALMGYHWEGHGVGEPAQSVLGEMDRQGNRLRQEARDYLDRVAGDLRARSLSVQTRVVVERQPAAAILDESAGSAFDLIALETHGRRGLSRLVLGSVADKVIRGAALPVLVHRPVSL